MFHLAWPIRQTLSAEFTMDSLAGRFPVPWSAYMRLLAVKDDRGRRIYETEALHGGWSVRQLDRRINSMFYERTALSKAKWSTSSLSSAAISLLWIVRDDCVLMMTGTRLVLFSFTVASGVLSLST